MTPARISQLTSRWPPAGRLLGAAQRIGRWALPFLAGLVLLAAAGANALEAHKLLGMAQKLGSNATAQAQALIQQIAEAAAEDERARLKRINSFLNRRIEYREDKDAWGVPDYWASPLEALNKGAGDCEDYAIAKYFSLISSGVPAAKMRLVYVRAQVGGSVFAHMVLAYYPEPTAEPLILDNLITDIRPASRRTDLAPVFSFNAEGLWQGVGGTTAGDPVARLSRWRDVLTKARAEGWW